MSAISNLGKSHLSAGMRPDVWMTPAEMHECAKRNGLDLTEYSLVKYAREAANAGLIERRYDRVGRFRTIITLYRATAAQHAMLMQASGARASEYAVTDPHDAANAVFNAMRGWAA